MINYQKNLNLFFATPIWTFQIDNHSNINDEIFNYIKDLQSEDPIGVKKSNNLGWHSKLFNMHDKEVKSFFQSIQKYIGKAIDDSGWNNISNNFSVTSAWTIINVKSSSNSRHIHSNNYLSAAYYVKAPKDCGDIIFYDPRNARLIRKPITNKENILNAETVKIKPQDGLLVLFPSYLYHSVEENLSNEERIVISFNLDTK
tara:strand:+ start:259 stop:861 length:603 start_codon:yes stop_codon:yes gene_type:complete